MDIQLNKQYLYDKKHAKNVHQKLVSDSLGKGHKTSNPYRKRFTK